MAADILRIHIDETMSVIKQTFDDKSVSRAQVAYLYIIVANDLLSKHISKRDSGAFLTVFNNVPLSKESDRKFIDLPGLIFDYDKDGAIEYLAYTSDGGTNCPPRFTKVPFTRTSPSEAQWLYLHPSTKPSPKLPYYYRVGSRLYTLGLESVPITELETGLYLTVDPLQEIDIDTPFNFPQELLKTLKMQVIDLIRYNWFFPKDVTNTGEDETTGGKVNQQKIVSVNPQQEQ